MTRSLIAAGQAESASRHAIKRNEDSELGGPQIECRFRNRGPAFLVQDR